MDENFVTKMIDYKFIPIVEAEVNGRKAFFLLDTGASISVLDSNRMGMYEIRKYESQDTNVIGYGGVAAGIYSVSPFKMKMGETKIHGDWVAKDIDQISKTVYKNTGRRILGILGNNNIAPNGFVLDFKKGNITKY